MTDADLLDQLFPSEPADFRNAWRTSFAWDDERAAHGLDLIEDHHLREWIRLIRLPVLPQLLDTMLLPEPFKRDDVKRYSFLLRESRTFRVNCLVVWCIGLHDEQQVAS